MLVEESEGLLFIEVEGILLAVAHTVQEFCVLTSADMATLVQVGNSENLFHGRLAAGHVNLCGNKGSNITVVRLINTIKIAILQFFETKVVVSDEVTTKNDEIENNP